MKVAVASIALIALLAGTAAAAELTIRSARLRAEITLDPWRLAFVDDDRGVVLGEADAQTPGPAGSIGCAGACCRRKSGAIDAATGVLRVSVTGPRGRLTVIGCSS
jgi:hypothetical protein